VTLLIVAAAVVAYLFVVAFVMTLLMAGKRADADLERARRALGRRGARWDDRGVAEEDPPEEITVRRRAG
jgi:hypothetical protein